MFRSKERHTANNGQILFLLSLFVSKTAKKQNEQNYIAQQK